MIELLDGRLLNLLVAETRDHAIFLLDADGRVATWNAGAERFKGYTESEIVGRHFSVFYPAEDVETGKPERELEVAESVGRFEDEGWRLRKDGTRFWASVVITALRDSEGTLRGFGKVTRDLTERRDRELAAGYQCFQRMVQDVQDYAIFMLDIDGKVATWNAGAERFKGYQADEIVGRHFSVFYPAEELAAGKPERMLELAARDGRVQDEGWRVRRDGTLFWAHVVITALRDGDGTLRGFGKVTRDRTASREQDLRLRAAEEQFRRAFEDAPIGMVIVDLNARFVEVNEAFGTMTGYPREALVGLPCRAVAHPDEADQSAMTVARLIAGEDRTLAREGRFIHADGHTVWATIHTTLVRDADGQPHHFISQVQDITERREQEQALRTSEARLRAIVENTPAPIVLRDLDGRYEHVNSHFAGLVGIAAQDLIGRSPSELYPAEVVQEVLAQDERLVSSREPIVEEMTVPHEDGTSHHYHVAKYPVLDDDGSLIGLGSISLDVTDRRAVEERLRERDLQFATAQALAQVGSYVWDVTKPNMEFSDELCRIFGQPIGFSPPYQEAFDLIHPDDRDVLKRHADRAVKCGELGSEIDEYRIIRPDGSIRMVHGRRYARTGPDGRVTHLVGTVQDVTEQHANLERLRTDAQEQDALRALATLVARETEPQVIFSVAARRAAEILGADFAGVVRVEPPGDARLVGTWSTPGFTTTPERSALSAPITVNGRRWGAINIEWAHHDGPGSDATERIARIADLLSLAVTAAESRQRQAREAHASRLESLGQMAGGVAHDFNNLLAVIIGYAQFAADALPAESAISSDIQEIVHAAQQASDLTQQLLTFSRRQTTEHEPIALNEVIGEMECLLRRTLGDHIRLDTNLDPCLAMIVANRGQLGQLLVNLAVNARDAMPNGGQLTITTTNETVTNSAVARHGGLRAGPCVRLQVTDTGAGMPADVRDRAFEPFYTTKPPGHGTGLGLATVHGVVTQSHGSIKLSSKPGHGTTCTIHFPASQDRPRTQGPPTAPTALATGGGQRILVVDDQDALRRAAVRTLSRAGYHVTEAAGPLQALDLLDGQRFDLLLSDIVMPEMLGTELSARALAFDGSLRVLYMSGYQELGADLSGQAPEREPILNKPFTSDQLLAAVAVALDQPAPSAALV